MRSNITEGQKETKLRIVFQRKTNKNLVIMAYPNKFSMVATVVVLFLAVTFTPRLAEGKNPKTVQKMDSVCAVAIPEIVKHCYATLSLSPSEECCTDLKTASKVEVTCLCDNFIAKPSNGSVSRALYDQISTTCGVLDKFACTGANGGAMTKIAASMSLFALVTNLLFLIQ